MIFLTGWSRSVVIIKQAKNEVMVLVYYLSFIYVVSYLYMNIVYGMMMVNEQENNPRKITYAALEEENSFKKRLLKRIKRTKRLKKADQIDEDGLLALRPSTNKPQED